MDGLSKWADIVAAEFRLMDQADWSAPHVKGAEAEEVTAPKAKSDVQGGPYRACGPKVYPRKPRHRHGLRRVGDLRLLGGLMLHRLWVGRQEEQPPAYAGTWW